MHIEFLVEDSSGKIMLEGLLPKILSERQTTYKCELPVNFDTKRQ